MELCLLSMIFPTNTTTERSTIFAGVLPAIGSAWGEPFLAFISVKIAYTANRPQTIFREFID